MKYRNIPMRLKNWDYRNAGAYFVTINIEERHKQFFGKIKDGIMHPSEIGFLAERFWMEIPNHFAHVRLENFVLMPDHVHGVLVLDGKVCANTVSPLQCNGLTVQCNGPAVQCNGPAVQCNGPAVQNSRPSINQKMSSISPKPGSLSTIIRSYKSVVSKNARKTTPSFKWQKLFNDHIIRDQRAFENIQRYIINNPKKWEENKLLKRKNSGV